MDISLTTHKKYLNRPATDLPTPALIISRPVLERNVARLHSDVEKLGIAFRPHVKTLKTIEATRVMLGHGKHRRVVASTLCEIRGVLPLVKEGVLDQCLYGLPIRPSVLPDLEEFISQGLEILLMIDHEDHVKLLEEHAARTGRQGTPWKAFIKIDIGSHRAGVENSSSRLDALIAQANASSHVDIYGIYCHAGHSYASKTTEDAVKVLEQEFGGVFEASKKLTLKAGQEVVLSIGATPTAHVVSHLQKSVPAGMTLELHAGNFPANDLQQFATGLVAESDQAVRVLAEVCSVYPERNEALINAGVLALTREPGPISGLARLTGDKFDWSILRVSQEHGILGWAGDAEKKQKAEDVFSIGQRLLLYTQHACITSAMYHIYYVVDEDDIVRETWTPWKGW